MSRRRDTQRSRVYAWEQSQNPGRVQWTQTMTLEEVEAFIKPIWRTERGRYGKTAYQRAPVVESRRGSGAVAFADNRLAFSKKCSNAYVALHELAHALDKRSNPGHGPRFVGILIGLLARHLGRDPDLLLATAYEQGLRVDTRAIGAVPRQALGDRIFKYLPGTDIGIAVAYNFEHTEGISFRQVRGAALRLIAQGRARWRGKKLVTV